MKPILSIDIETRSKLDLKDCGVFRYANDPSTKVMCIGYAFTGEPAKIIRTFEGELPPREVIDHIKAGGLVSAFNAAFDVTVLNLHQYAGMSQIRPFQIVDTQAMANACGLFGKLDDVLQQLGAENRKDAEGKKVMLKLCKPNRKGVWVETPELLEKLYDYCINDVNIEKQLLDKLPRLPAMEQFLWEDIYKANLRGVPIDVKAAKHLAHLVDKAKEQAAVRIEYITRGAVKGLDAHKQLKEWIQDKGVYCESTDKASVTSLLNSELPDNVREVLTLRQENGLSSTAKLEAMIRCEVNGFVRGVTSYYGANTGREAGRLVQMQNLARPETKHDKIEKALDTTDFRGMLEDLGSIPKVAKDCIRGLIQAPEGYKWVSADYSNIEGRVLAWLAGEEWRLQAFRDQDAGKGGDMYVLSYKQTFKCCDDEALSNRQKGKTLELACLTKETKVLTAKGWKQIIEISEKDLLWDGDKWVKSKGVHFMGFQNVINVMGVSITKNHMVLTNRWEEIQDVLKGGTLYLAMETGKEALQSLGALGIDFTAKVGTLNLKSFVIAAAMRTLLRLVVIYAANLQRVICALKQRLERGKKNILSTLTLYKTWSIGGDYSGGFQLFSQEQTPRMTRRGIMERGGYSLTNLGEKIRRFFLSTSLHLKGGTNRVLNSIGSIMIKGTSRAICGSLVRARTLRIEEVYTNFKSAYLNWKHKLKDLKQRRAVYDIVDCGDLNRFVIKCSDGAMVVHNCGFQGGVGAFRRMEGIGQSPYSDAEVDVLIKAWRQANPAIVKLWEATQAAAVRAIKMPGALVQASRNTAFKCDGKVLKHYLPNGRAIWYQNAKLSAGKYGSEITYVGKDSVTGRICTLKTYGGSLVQGATQGTARDVLCAARFRLTSLGWDYRYSVHDEVNSLEPINGRSVDDYIKIMTMPVNWAEGLPVAAAGWEGRRYRK